MIFSSFTKYLAAENLWLRGQLERANERIDRLTEALAKKNDLNLVMPQPPLPQPLYQPAGIARELEKSSSWFENKPIPAVRSNSGGNNK